MSQKSIKILFDANAFMVNKTGVGHYTSRLIKSMAQQYPDEVQLVGYYYNFLGRKRPPVAPIATNISYRPILLFPAPLIHLLRRLHIELPIELLTLTKPDFILYPNFLSHPSLFRTPSAPIIYDLSYHDLPEYGSEKAVHDLQQFVPDSIKRAAFIVSISEFSKRRICDVYGVADQNIVTTFIPPEKPLLLKKDEAAQLVQSKKVQKPYILFIGTLEPRKNIAALLEAYTQLSDTVRNTYSLVIAGKIDWKYKETTEKLEKLQSEGYDIHYLGYVDDQMQAALYSEASLFVLPSHYEGFGMPILEALSYDTPCAVSDIPVFHEVGGEAVTYFDNNDTSDIAQKITSALLGTSRPAISARQYIGTLPTWAEVGSIIVKKISSQIKK